MSHVLEIAYSIRILYFSKIYVVLFYRLCF